MSKKRKFGITHWINTHTDQSQTYINIFLTLITFIALMASMYYSRQSLKETIRSNDNSTKQLKIAQDQFDSSKAETARLKIKETTEIKEETRKTYLRKIKDSIDSVRIALNDKKLQNNFDQQKKINEKQLVAISKQASTAEAQFNLQQAQYADLYERNKPVFEPDSVIVNKYKLAKSLISFHIINIGHLKAHVDSTYIAVYNPQYLYFNYHTGITNSDVVESGSFITFGIDIFNDCINKENTFYCVIIYYYDSADRKERAIPKLFRYAYNSKKEFRVLPLNPVQSNELFEEVNKKSRYKRL